MIASVKRHRAELLSDIGFVKNKITARDMEKSGGMRHDGVAQAVGEAPFDVPDFELVKAILVSALYPNVIKIEAPSLGGGRPPNAQDLKFRVRGNEDVFIHPSSIVNFFLFALYIY